MNLFAGQSLVLSPGSVSATVPLPNSGGISYRVELQLIQVGGVWGSGSFSQALDLNGGPALTLNTSSSSFRFGDKQDSGGNQCDLTAPSNYVNVVIRIQRDSVGGTFTCEIWNWDSTGYYSPSPGSITPVVPSWATQGFSGGVIGSSSAAIGIGFLKMFSTLLPAGSRPPVTAGIADIVNYTFDGTLADSSGHAYNITWSTNDCATNTPCYAATPNQTSIAFPKTYGVPSWGNQVSFRAGYAGQLDGTSSYSMADSSASVTYFWQLLSGPSSPQWSSRTSAAPTVTGLIFGNYRFQLCATDATPTTSCSILDVGAVATDNNGVVVNANPAADAIFGPMIAFGKNPWQWEDSSSWVAANVRAPQLAAIVPPWAAGLAVNGAGSTGSIAYIPWASAITEQTTLCASAAPTDATITICNRTKLDFSSLPATPVVIHIGDEHGFPESVLVTAITNGSGTTATLTVPYSGRAYNRTVPGGTASPSTWANGSPVNMMKTVGTGTNFLSVLCQGGVGEVGAAVYNTGTVHLTHGSTTVTVTGGTWPLSDGLRLRATATHGGGTAFVFFGTIDSGSGTSATLHTAYPSDADDGDYTYAILNQTFYMVRRYENPTAHNKGQQKIAVDACMSDTQVYHNGSDNIPAATGGYDIPQSGQTWSYQNFVLISDLGPQYYDGALGDYANYLRSGHGLFLTNARHVADYWGISPESDQGWLANPPRRVALTGFVAAAAIDNVPGHDTSANWTAIRRIAANGADKISTNCDDYLRESAYSVSWPSLAAMFDPINTGGTSGPSDGKSYWQSLLAAGLTREQACMGSSGEYYQASFIGNVSNSSSAGSNSGATPVFTGVTVGATTLTGTGITPDLCPVASTGTVTSIHPGDTAVVGTGFIVPPTTYGALANKIVILAQRSGQPYLFFSRYTYTDSTHITLLTPFDGDAGTYNHHIEDDQGYFAIASSNLDYSDVNKFYACTYVDSTHITIDRPWTGATGTLLGSRNYTADIGYGNNPFQQGIKVLQFKYQTAGLQGNPTYSTQAAAFATLRDQTATWVVTNGFDPVTGGLYYARGNYNCEPPGINKYGCDYGPGTEAAARQLNAEAQNACALAYAANPTTANRNFCDQFYGAQWGKPGFGTYGSFPLPYSDGIYNSTLDDNFVWLSKWPGFNFGVGMAHQWPAARLGGVQAAVTRTIQVPFTLSGISSAAEVEIAIVEPSSLAHSLAVCLVSPCAVTADARQGYHLFRMSYRNTAHQVIAAGDPIPLYVQ